MMSSTRQHIDNRQPRDDEGGHPARIAGMGIKELCTKVYTLYNAIDARKCGKTGRSATRTGWPKLTKPEKHAAALAAIMPATGKTDAGCDLIDKTCREGGTSITDPEIHPAEKQAARR